jgi:choline dehydrogenase-like flavoprotein
MTDHVEDADVVVIGAGGGGCPRYYRAGKALARPGRRGPVRALPSPHCRY